MDRWIRRHQTDHRGEALPREGQAVCSLAGVPDFLDRLISLAAFNPEGVGYADFSLNGQPSGVEIWVKAREGFHLTITVDRSVGLLRRRDEPGERALQELGPEHLIDEQWTLNYVHDSPEVTSALYKILRHVVGCPESSSLTTEFSWS